MAHYLADASPVRRAPVLSVQVLTDDVWTAVDLQGEAPSTSRYRPPRPAGGRSHSATSPSVLAVDRRYRASMPIRRKR